MSKVKSILDQWVAMLTKYNLLNIEDLPKEINIPEIGKALDVISEISMSRDERDIYHAHLDFLRIEDGAFEARFEAGREVGIKEGRLKIACNLLNEGWDIEVIARATELSIDEIKQYNKREYSDR